jgi:diacylglycerol kinase family enzyme
MTFTLKSRKFGKILKLHSVKIRRWDCFSKRVFEKGFKKIIAICGDGTINEVAKGFFTFNEDKENAVRI